MKRLGKQLLTKLKLVGSGTGAGIAQVMAIAAAPFIALAAGEHLLKKGMSEKGKNMYDAGKFSQTSALGATMATPDVITDPSESGYSKAMAAQGYVKHEGVYSASGGDPRLNDAKFMEEAKATVANRDKLITPSETGGMTTEKIPLVVDQPDTTNQLQLDKIGKTMETVVEEIKKGNDTKKFPYTRSGKDTYNSKNPIVSALSYGVVSVE